MSQDISTQRRGLLGMFQGPKGKKKLSIGSIFGGQKQREAQALHERAKEDAAAIVRALSGGVEVGTPKNTAFTARGLLASEARLLLEKTAGKLTVDNRTAVLRTWTKMLKADAAALMGDDAASGSTALSSHSSCDSGHGEGAAGLSGPDSPATPQQGEGGIGDPGGPFGNSGSPDFTIKAAGSGIISLFDEAARANICFRDLFLKSLALELVVKGFLVEPPTSEEEEQLLHQLLQLTLVKAHSDFDMQLVEVVVKLGNAMASHTNLKPMLRDTLVNVTCQAISGLKVHAELGKLERQIEEVQSTLSLHLVMWNELQLQQQQPPEEGREPQQSPGGESGEDLKQEHGAETPSWEVAQQVWELSCELKGLTAQRHAILERQAAFDFTVLKRMVEEPTTIVEAEVVTLHQQLEETTAQLKAGTGFRSERFGKVKGQLMTVSSDISALEGKKARLLLELEKVEDELRRLYKVQSDLEEERNVFEEGSALTLENLGDQMEILKSEQASALMAAATLRSASALVGLASDIANASTSSALQEAENARNVATEKVVAAAGRLCKLQEQELCRCVEAMKAASETLSLISTKQVYEDILHYEALEAVSARRQGAVEAYLEAEMSAYTTLHEISQVQDSVRICYRNSGTQRAFSQSPSPDALPSPFDTGTASPPSTSPPLSPRRFSRNSSALQDATTTTCSTPLPTLPPIDTTTHTDSNPSTSPKHNPSSNPSSPSHLNTSPSHSATSSAGARSSPTHPHTPSPTHSAHASSPRYNRPSSGNLPALSLPSSNHLTHTPSASPEPSSPTSPPTPPSRFRSSSRSVGWPPELYTTMLTIDALRREFESIQRPEDVKKFDVAAAAGDISTSLTSGPVMRASRDSLLVPQPSQQLGSMGGTMSILQMGSMSMGSSFLPLEGMGSGFAHSQGGGGSRGQQGRQGDGGMNEEPELMELPSPCDAGIISYAALMGGPPASAGATVEEKGWGGDEGRGAVKRERSSTNPSPRPGLVNGGGASSVNGSVNSASGGKLEGGRAAASAVGAASSVGSSPRTPVPLEI